MINFLKRGIYFVRENLGIFYSLLLLVVIPLAFYYNTFFTLESFQENIDFNLQTKTLLAEVIFSTFAAEVISNEGDLQAKINQITEENPEISGLRVILPAEEEFEVAYSKNLEEVGTKAIDDSIPLSWHRNQAIAHLATNQANERFWEVIRPLHDSEGEKIGLVSMSISLREADMLAVEVVKRVYIVAIATILLTLFLIIHHTRLFQYVVLFRKLKKEDKEKDDFMNMAMHELKGPIVNMRNYILTLKEEIGVSLNKIQKQYLDRALISSERLNDLTSDMLDVVRIQQKRLSFESEKISPQKIIQSVVQEFKPEAEKKNLQLLFRKRDVFFVNANPNRLKEVLVNLINNAIKYTQKGKVEIRTEIEGNKRCLIIIEDTGIGVSAEEQQRLGEKFFRIKSEETEDIPGTGLGLWIINEICVRMGGKLLVESIKGKGSKFIVVLPLAEKQLPEQPGVKRKNFNEKIT